MTTTFATINTINALFSQNVEFKVLTDIDEISDPSFEAKIGIDSIYNNLVEHLNGFVRTMGINQEVIENSFTIWNKNKELSAEEIHTELLKTNN